MKLYIQQHVFTWGARFSIYNEAGDVRYRAEGEILTLGRKLHLYDHAENEAAYIEQQLFTFRPRYLVCYRGEVFAEVVKEFTLFYPEYTVKGPDWKVSGDFFSHEYEVTDSGGAVIASVSKQWFTLGDAYEISIEAGADEVTALAMVLTIDACLS